MSSDRLSEQCASVRRGLRYRHWRTGKADMRGLGFDLSDHATASIVNFDQQHQSASPQIGPSDKAFSFALESADLNRRSESPPRPLRRVRVTRH